MFTVNNKKKTQKKNKAWLHFAPLLDGWLAFLNLKGTTSLAPPPFPAPPPNLSLAAEYLHSSQLLMDAELTVTEKRITPRAIGVTKISASKRSLVTRNPSCLSSCPLFASLVVPFSLCLQAQRYRSPQRRWVESRLCFRLRLDLVRLMTSILLLQAVYSSSLFFVKKYLCTPPRCFTKSERHLRRKVAENGRLNKSTNY